MSEVRVPAAIRVVCLALLLAAAGCQLPLPSTRTQPSPSAVPPADRRVAAADAKLYAGDYEGAEAAYRALLADRVPGAASHLSTLLAHESRFQEAIAQAQAGVAVRADSDSLARLTRALDWAQSTGEAVKTGARAVATRPVHPLARIFYAEALADSGRFGDAERELLAAERMGGDDYIRAEIYREWANYYRSRGDGQAELNYTQLEVKAQPGFPERRLDLVRYNYGNQRPEAARAAMDKALSGKRKEYWTLVTAADAALVGGDIERAPSLYRAAAEIRPEGSEAALGLAEVAVAVNRDFNGAHDLLLGVLKRDPTSSGVYEYLRYLDLLVLKRDPDAELGPIAPQRPAALAADRKAALDQLNARRSALGVPALREDPALDEAAQAHAYYYLFNASQAQVSGSGISSEDQSLPGFTGAHSIDRDRRFGYTGTRGVEVANHGYSPAASVDNWIDSVFHRYPLLDRETVVGGYGTARVGPVAISVLDVGADQPSTGEPVLYPGDGQSEVPAAFTGNEVPDPLPKGAIPPAGYPVTLALGGAQKLTVTTGRLLDASGHEVPSYALAPGSAVGAAQWALVAKQPLKPGARYTAEVVGTVDGKDFSRRWSFTVAGP